MNTPPPVTRGENSLSAVCVDWVSLVCPMTAVGTVQQFVARVRRLFDETVGAFVESGKGLNCYAYSMREPTSGISIAWGGNGGGILLVIPGNACARVVSWPALAQFIVAHAGHLTRVDLAFDDFDGVHDLAEAVDMYLSDGFGFSNGRPPSSSQAGNWLRPDGSGRTLYIGKAANGKMLRVYEKGKEKGDKHSPWVRWEVQFGNRDRSLPVEMLLDPATFLRGSYPCLGFVYGEGTRIATRKAEERISTEKLVRHAREAYGALVSVLVASGATADEVVALIRRDGLPRRLNAPTDIELCERGNALAQLFHQAEGLVDANLEVVR